MSQENVELFDAGFRALKSSGRCLTSTSSWTSAIPFVDADDLYFGRDAVIEATRRYWGTWR